MRSPFLKIICLLLLLCNAVKAQIASRPYPQRLVNNLSKTMPGFLSADEKKRLEDTLVAFERATSNQICIVIVDELGGMTASQYATAVLNEWGVGQAKLNNGIVILVKPTGGPGQRDLAISTGYGLEGAITDIETKRVRENEIEPEFKNGNFYLGLHNGCKALMIAAKGEYNTSVSGKGSGIFGWFFDHPIISILIVILLFWIFSKGKRGGGSGTTFGNYGGSYRSYSSGSSWSSGSSGGGFGGFGGGSGGGGGSSGKW